MEDDEKLRQFNEAHNQEYSSPPLDLTQPQGTPGQAPNMDGLSPEDQATFMKLKAQMEAANPGVNVNANPAPAAAAANPAGTPAPAAPYVAPNIQTAGNVCPECGVMHPPVPPGQRCPNAKVDLPTISDAEIGQFIGSWKNIIVSQLEKRNFKEPKKVFQQATLMLTKFLEEYEEKEEENVEPNPTGESPPESPN